MLLTLLPPIRYDQSWVGLPKCCQPVVEVGAGESVMHLHADGERGLYVVDLQHESATLKFGYR